MTTVQLLLNVPKPVYVEAFGPLPRSQDSHNCVL